MTPYTPRCWIRRTFEGMRVRMRFLSGFVASALIMVGAGTASAHPVTGTEHGVLAGPPTFFQENVEIEGVPHPNSAWGLVDFHYKGSAELLYTNVTVNGRWVIQNMPLASPGDAPIEYEMTYPINLGVHDGTEVRSLTYGISVTAGITSSSPPSASHASVLPLEVAYQSGEIGTALIYTRPAEFLVGGQAADNNKHALKPAKDQVLPNQEQKATECVPTAVSNSLQWLNGRFNLRLTAAQMSIETMKTATGWEEGGTRPGWWNTKDAYMKKNGYPIATTTTDKLSDIVTAIDKNWDVELRVPGHVMFVVAITPLGNGDYSIEVNDDPDTKQNNGTKPKTLKYDQSTGKLIGTEWSAPFKDAGNIIIESPK